MGKLSLYKSKKYLKRKQRKLTSGHPFKVSKFTNRNKDIDTTLSYSDNCENDMSQSTRTHAINFYCSGDPPCDSLLSAHRNSVNSTSSSANNSTHESSDAGSSSEEGESEYPNNEDNVWNSTYAQNCLAMLKRDSLLKPLIKVLYANSCLKDYMTLVHHELDRGFSFHTTNRAAYPYHTLEKPHDQNLTVFDMLRRRKKRKEQSLLALPKAITRGTLPICEHHCKNESKVLLHKRAGVPDAFNPLEPS